MPRIDLDILNQKQTPAFYASSLATRPAASFVGRIFIDSDNPSTGLYRDTGTAWVQIADPGAGTTGTLQQVTTNGSSTTIGISTSGNGIGIGTTIPGSNRLDIHSGTGIQATFNGTGTTNAALQLQLAGVGKWNLSNLYNAAANDFIITDVLNSLNRLTIKNTGQTFIGTDVTSSGAFVVNNATSDNHIVCIGANAPSIRLRNTGTAPTLNVGFGISTATNNYIQGSASGNYCIFNSSTTASPILFGVYDAGTANTQEAARISAARNFLIGTSTDCGFKLSVSGTANITGVLTGSSSTFLSTTTNTQLKLGYDSSYSYGIGRNSSDGLFYFQAAGAGASGYVFQSALTGTSASFSSSVTTGAFLTNAASGNGGQEALRINNNNGYIGFFNGANTIRSAYIQGNTTDLTINTSLAIPILFGTSNVTKMTLDASGNLGLGVTPSAWSSSYRAFQFGATGVLWANATGTDWYLGNNEIYNSSNQLVYLTNGKATEYLQFDGKHIWYNAPSGTAGNAITYTQVMTLKNTGVLNINTTSIYATNALALSGGLVVGDIYKSATGVLSIVY